MLLIPAAPRRIVRAGGTGVVMPGFGPGWGFARRAGLGLGVACALAGAAGAREQMPAERYKVPYEGASNIPVCADPAVLHRIRSRFEDKEGIYWASTLTIRAIDQVRPLAVRPWGLDYIPRRFCTGVATTSDGVRRRIDYSVIEDAGIIGLTWGVEWCVEGLDRNGAFAPHCRMARP